MPYSDNFDSDTLGTLPSGWSNGSPTGAAVAAGAFVVTTNSPVSGTQAFGDGTDGHIALYTAGTSDSIRYDAVAQANAFIAPILCSDSAGTNHYLLNYNPTAADYTCYQHSSSGYTSLGNGGGLPYFAPGTAYTVLFTHSGSTLSVFVWAYGGTQPTTPTVTITGLSSPLATGYAGLRTTNQGGSAPSIDNVVIATGPGPAVITADNPALNYLGKWAVTGSGSAAEATTLTSGAQVRCVFTGTTCQLNFDVSLCNAGQYADLCYQLDGGGWNRVTLTATGTVTCAFPTFSGVALSTYAEHRLTVIVEGAFDAGTTAINIWGTLAGAVRFTGLTLDPGAGLVASPAPVGTIEFSGDSITDTVRLLGAGSFAPTLKGAHLGWPTLTAEALGLAPVCGGYPGNGYVQASNGSQEGTYSGVPLLGTSFGLVYSGVAYVPAVQPRVIVLAGGTNDQAQGVAAATFQAAYLAHLVAIRAAYPSTLIVCVVLASAGNYSAAIAAAATATGDSKVRVHDYSAGLFTAGDYSDGTHLNYGGGLKLATRLTQDIQADLAVYQAPTHGAFFF